MFISIGMIISFKTTLCSSMLKTSNTCSFLITKLNTTFDVRMLFYYSHAFLLQGKIDLIYRNYRSWFSRMFITAFHIRFSLDFPFNFNANWEREWNKYTARCHWGIWYYVCNKPVSQRGAMRVKWKCTFVEHCIE